MAKSKRKKKAKKVARRTQADLMHRPAQQIAETKPIIVVHGRADDLPIKIKEPLVVHVADKTMWARIMDFLKTL